MNHPLFSSYNLGSLRLRNRVVMAPMTRSRALGNLPNALMAEYYAQRSGAGLIVTEGTAPSPNALGYARIPGLFSPAQVEGWRLVTRAVHERGSRIFAQLMHVGRIGHPAYLPSGAELLAPSAVAAAGMMWTDSDGPQPHPTPRAMTLDDIESTQQEFEDAAANAIEAGFDGVELHGANGYLLEQFINPTTNLRTDAYGGSPERRARFVIEVAERTAKRIGPERVGIRLSPHNTFNDMGSYEGIREQYLLLAQAFSRASLAYIHVVRGPHVEPATLTAVQAGFGGPFVLNGGFDAGQAREVVAQGQADLIAFGSKFISNPDLVFRLQQGAALAGARPDSFYTPGAEGYTDYPAAS